MPKTPISPRPIHSSGSDQKPTVRPHTSLHQYRALHSQKIRRYYSCGDPVKDQKAAMNFFRMLLVFGALAAVLVVVVFALRKM